MMDETFRSIFNKFKVEWVRKNQNLMIGPNDFKIEVVNIDQNNDLFVRTSGKVAETKVLLKNLLDYHLGGYIVKNKKGSRSTSVSDEQKYIAILSDHFKEMEVKITRLA